MSAWWSGLAALARRADGIPSVGRAMRLAYRAAAEIAARTYGAIDEVDGVYLAGSLTRPEHLRPGISDIDLVVLANVPTLESELRLRRKLRRAHAALNGAMPVFWNLDYLEARDLDLLRHFGNAWCLDLDCRWLPMAGTNRLLAEPPARSAHERKLMRFVRDMKRWAKGTSSLFSAEGADRVRSERVLRDVLAEFSDSDRFSPVSELLGQIPVLSGTPSLDLLRDGADPTGEICLGAALEVLDSWSRTQTRDWRDEWRIKGTPPSAPVTPAAHETAERFLAAGFHSARVSSRGGVLGGNFVIAVAPNESAAATIKRAQGVRIPAASPAALSLMRYPVVLTPAMWRAAAVFSPEPAAGAAAACGGAWTGGDPLSTPPCPSQSDWDAIVRARVVRLMMRRLVRAQRDPGAWRREEAFDAQCLRPATATYEAEGVLDFSRTPDTGIEAEVDLVAKTRDWAEERRREFDEILARRHST